MYYTYCGLFLNDHVSFVKFKSIVVTNSLMKLNGVAFVRVPEVN
jgi:hypothetical protein